METHLLSDEEFRACCRTKWNGLTRLKGLIDIWPAWTLSILVHSTCSHVNDVNHVRR